MAVLQKPYSEETIMKSKLVFGVLIIIIVLASSGCIEILKEGRHSGQITAIEKNGFIWKTNTVYLKSEIESSQEDRYCVEDELLFRKLGMFAEDRMKVTVLYRDELYKAPWRCSLEDKGIITGVKLNEDKDTANRAISVRSFRTDKMIVILSSESEKDKI